MKGKAWKLGGFTLIELLVVIAIIAILAAILFPVFASVKEKGRQTKCMNNMKQLGSATMSYIGDWQDTFPKTGGTDRYSPGFYDYTSWGTKILPYVRNKPVFLCPSDTDIKRNDPCSYGNNNFLGAGASWIKLPNGGYDYRRPYKPARLSQVKSPSRIVMWYEGFYDPKDGTKPWYCIDLHTWGGSFTYDMKARHNLGFTVACADGHAIWVQPKMYTLSEKNVGWDLNYQP